MDNKQLLVIVPGTEQTTDSVFYILVADTGECLASHFCSNHHFAKGDLYSRREERVKEWGREVW